MREVKFTSSMGEAAWYMTVFSLLVSNWALHLGQNMVSSFIGSPLPCNLHSSRYGTRKLLYLPQPRKGEESGMRKRTYSEGPE